MDEREKRKKRGVKGGGEEREGEREGGRDRERKLLLLGTLKIYVNLWEGRSQVNSIQ
jgi:hypothetical protein